MKQAISLPKSTASVVYDQLGYLESFDAVVDKVYALLIYKETRSGNGKWVVRIKGSVTAGSVFDPDNRSLENAIRKAMGHHQEYVVWGFNLTPKEGDPRLVENRLFFNQEGDPTRLEMHLITRDAEGGALPEKVARVEWPGTGKIDVEAGAANEFESFYAEYERACRAKDRGFLKAILPADIPGDEFEFVLDMSSQTALALEKSGVKPTFSREGDQMNVVYDGDLGDGMTNMVIDFYLHDGQWIKYNPKEEG